MPKKFDEMVSAIKRNLKKRYPKRSDSDIERSAYAIATSYWKKKHNSNP